MQRRPYLVICGGTLAGLAGCSGDTGSRTTTGTPTETETTVPESAVVDYGELSATQQEAFDRARDGVVRFGTGVPGLEKTIHYGPAAFEPFREHDYVRKGGTLYRLSTGRSGVIGGTRVAVEPADAADESAIALENRTGEGVELLVAAIETDGAAAAVRVDPPEGISTGDLVAYDGEQFRVTQVSTRDYEYRTLAVNGTAGG